MRALTITSSSKHLVRDSTPSRSHSNYRVKLGQSKKDGKYYAVKIINENSSSQDSNIKAIMNESKILQKLNHPNIVHLYELRDDGNYVYPDGTSKKYTKFMIEFCSLSFNSPKVVKSLTSWPQLVASLSQFQDSTSVS